MLKTNLRCGCKFPGRPLLLCRTVLLQTRRALFGMDASCTRRGVTDMLRTHKQVHINHGVSSNQHINKPSLSGSSHHPNGSKHAAAAAAAELFPEQMAGGSRPLPRAANGRLVCLFMINAVLQALITCAALPSGSGAAFARQAGKQ